MMTLSIGGCMLDIGLVVVESEHNLNAWLPTVHRISYTSIVLLSLKNAQHLFVGGCVLGSGSTIYTGKM